MTSGPMGGAIKGSLRATCRFVASTRLAKPSCDAAHVCRSQASSKALIDWMVEHGAPKQAGTSAASSLNAEFPASSPLVPRDGGPSSTRSRSLAPSSSADVRDPITVTLKSVERGGRQIDVTVADRPLKAGDIALRVPENLIVTLAQIFECGDASELLTTNTLSELAVLTLYLCYEKKKGKDSAIYPFIKELDRQAARGSQGAKSPLLWGVEDLELLVRVPQCIRPVVLSSRRPVVPAHLFPHGSSSASPHHHLTPALRAVLDFAADRLPCRGGN